MESTELQLHDRKSHDTALMWLQNQETGRGESSLSREPAYIGELTVTMNRLCWAAESERASESSQGTNESSVLKNIREAMLN